MAKVTATFVNGQPLDQEGLNQIKTAVNQHEDSIATINTAIGNSTTPAGLASVVAGQSAMTDKVKTRLSILVAHTHLLSYGQEALSGRSGMWVPTRRLSTVTYSRGVLQNLIV